MKEYRFHIGPGAASFMMISIVLCMSVLGILTLMNAQNDYDLTKNSIAVTQIVYELNDRAEESLNELANALKNGILPEKMEREGDTVSWVEAEGCRVLSCVVRIGDDGKMQWISHQLNTVFEETEQHPFAF